MSQHPRQGGWCYKSPFHSRQFTKPAGRCTKVSVKGFHQKSSDNDYMLNEDGLLVLGQQVLLMVCA